MSKPSVPRIECPKCGEENHYDEAIHPGDPGPGHCQNCYGFLREPTEKEHRQFTEFLKWNTDVFEAREVVDE